MRKNRLFILGIFTVMVALVSLSLVSGTWAKYTSSVSGTDTATVAKWEVAYATDGQADVKGNVTNQTIVFNLFGTLEGESNVEETDGTLVAPGTKGSFKFIVKNNSEVTAKCSIVLSVDKEIAPIVYTFDGNEYETMADLSTAVNAQLSGTNMTWDSTKEVTIGWKWEFEVDDVADTTLGVTPISSTVTAAITFVQVD